ncbi:MAG: peptidylprolyl isomerase [Alphaproteobacteria bacterium]
MMFTDLKRGASVLAKRALPYLCVLFALTTAAPAQVPAQVPAQAPAPAQVREPAVRDVQSIAAVVNHEVVSVYDLLERMKLVIFSTDLKDNPETRQRLLPLVLRSLVDEHLQMQEAERLNITVSETEISQAMTTIEKENNIKTGNLDALLAKAQIDRNTVVDQVKASLAWGKVIRRVIRPTIDIGEDEVTDTLKRIEADKDKPQDLLAEIFLAVDQPNKADEVRDTADKLVSQIVGGASFPALARQFSESATAFNGGDIGWVVEGQLEPELAAVVKLMRPPSVSHPIKTAAGFYIVALRDRRVMSEEEAKGRAVRLRQVQLPLPAGAGASKEEIAKAMKHADAMGQKAHSCDEMTKLAKESESDLSGDLGWIELADMPQDLRKVVEKLPVNRISQPVKKENAVVLYMVCERKEPKSLIPTRDEIAQVLLRKRIELQGDRYMRELRSNATVDKRI